MKNIYCNYLQSWTEQAGEDSSSNLVSKGILSHLVALRVGGGFVDVVLMAMGYCCFLSCGAFFLIEARLLF